MHQRDETEVRELLFAAVGNRRLSGTLERDVAFICGEVVRRKTLDQSATFHAADRSAPAIQRKGLRQASAQRIRCIAPQIFGVVSAVDRLLIVEGFDRLVVSAVRKPRENMRQAETY